MEKIQESLKLDKFFQYSPNLLCLLNLEGIFIKLNQSWKQVLGFELEQLALSSIQNWVYPDDKDAASQTISAIIENHHNEEFRFRFSKKDGGFAWLKGTLVFDEETQLLFGTFIDISLKIQYRESYKNAQERIDFLNEATHIFFDDMKDSQKLLEKFVQHIVPDIADYSSIDITDEAGNIQMISMAHRDAEKMALLNHLYEKYPRDPDNLYGYNNIIQSQESLFIPELNLKKLLDKTQDENLRKILSTLDIRSIISVPISAQQKVLGVMNFIMSESGRSYSRDDISFLKDIGKRAGLALNIMKANSMASQEYQRRREAQKSLKKSEDLLNAIFRDATDNIYTVDKNGSIFFINHTVSGLTNKDIVGSTIFDYHNVEQIPMVQEVIQRVFEKGESGYYETQRMLNGQIRYFASKASPLINDGIVYAASIISRDITPQMSLRIRLKEDNELLEKRVAERTCELQEANEELGAFAYSVSHDLRAPLRAMVGYSQILLEEYEDDLIEDARNCVEIINDEAKRMGILIDNLLEFSRMQRKEASKVEFNMKDLVEQVYKEYKIDHPADIFEFQCGNLPRVMGDANMLKHVWANLLSNAVKYSKEDVPNLVEVDCKEEENKYIFSVSDRGVGFDMKYSNKLFGVFQRLHAQNEFEGVGIGLALSKKIINRHKGKIWAESILQEGSTFYFSLPK